MKGIHHYCKFVPEARRVPAHLAMPAFFFSPLLDPIWDFVGIFAWVSISSVVPEVRIAVSF